MLKNRLQRPRIAAADVVEISRGDLEPGHIALPLVPTQRLFEKREAALDVFLPPHASGWMQHVHMRDLRERHRHALE